MRFWHVARWVLLVLWVLAVALVLVGVLWFWLRLRKNKPAREVRIFSSIEQLRAIGELSVYKVMTKEIVTETDHSWGEIGSCWWGLLRDS